MARRRKYLLLTQCPLALCDQIRVGLPRGNTFTSVSPRSTLLRIMHYSVCDQVAVALDRNCVQ